MIYARQWMAIGSLGLAAMAGCGDGQEDIAQTRAPVGVGQSEGRGNGGQAACGNGVANRMEGCDDGGNEDGDGCSATCDVEPGYTCAGKKPSLCFTTCGDGIVAGAEACDDGGVAGGDGCDSSCNVQIGYACDGSPSVCAPICGDGLILAPEACDDGNSSAGDGCDADCGIEAGSSCVGAPSVCTPGCGDGAVGGSEGCDDGNKKDGDGCGKGCQIEQGFVCSGTRSLCCIPEGEPNDTSQLAHPLPMNVFGCGAILPLSDQDYFSFTLPVESDVVIKTYNDAGSDIFCENTFIDLFDVGSFNGFVIPVRFFSYSSSVAGQPYQELATIPPMHLGVANGVAADSKYLYVTGNSWRLPGIGPQKDGIYRFDRANLLAPPVQIASYGVYPTTGGIHRALHLDDLANPKFLYGRDNNGDIHVVIDPAGVAEHVGVISALGGPTDRAMTYDRLENAIYFFETESNPTGRLVKLQ